MMDVLADLTISTMAFATVQLLDLSDASTQSRQDFENKMSRQLQLIYVGAANWKRKEPL